MTRDEAVAAIRSIWSQWEQEVCSADAQVQASQAELAEVLAALAPQPTSYVVHLWTPGYRPTRRNQAVIHRADCPQHGEPVFTIPTIIVDHLRWEPDVVYPHGACCPDLRKQMGASQ